ncbi:MAG TPA: sarcosine oxidase subunit gamma family protein [Geminicoccaceae bacterium]|nr:sarcosine oxidase subunit gamma family protein [Geminicoccus sp.]HMU50086.1 sarcosine oxidase subunit gamma family protein [Geminicoccaceae bacterium]
MAEPFLASPTADLPAIVGTGVTVVEAPFRGKLVLRLDPAGREKASATLGFLVPARPLAATMADQAACLWLGPDEWLLLCPADLVEPAIQALDEALEGCHHAVVDVSHRIVTLRLAGPRVTTALAAGCPLDLHGRVFPSGSVARSLLGKVGITLHRLDAERFELHVDRSFAEYAWLFLAEAARELNG